MAGRMEKDRRDDIIGYYRRSLTDRTKEEFAQILIDIQQDSLCDALDRIHNIKRLVEIMQGEP